MLEPEDLVGHKIDQYEINQYLATGSMAYVYRGRDIALDRDVAVKILHPNLLVDESFVTRFRREASIIAHLRHPNIVQIYTTGITAEALHYIVMEYVQGGTLADKLSYSALPAFDASQALLLIRQVAEALSAAHQAGIIHGDVKPSNILLRPEGTPVLADLGMGLALNESQARLTLTDTFAVVFTPNYVSPEQVSGEDPDNRSDIYSLGIVLYELLAGRPPFAGESPLAIILGHLMREPEPLEDVRPSLALQTYQIVHRCIRKTAEERYESTEELVEAIDQAILAENRRAAQRASSDLEWPPAYTSVLPRFEEDMAGDDDDKTQLWSYDPDTTGVEEKLVPEEKVEVNHVVSYARPLAVEEKLVPEEKVEARPTDPKRSQMWIFTPEPAGTLVPLRLDAALPDQVFLGRSFELAVAVRQPDSLVLSEADLNQTKSGNLLVTWPKGTPSLALRVHVSAPECTIYNQAHSFQLYKGYDSPVFYFQLTPNRAGRIGIVVTVYQEQDWLGGTRLHTLVNEQVTGKVEIEVFSRPIAPSQETLVNVAFQIKASFSPPELRTLCFDMGVSHDDLRGETHAERARELVAHMVRRGRFHTLLQLCQKKRAHIDWFGLAGITTAPI